MEVSSELEARVPPVGENATDVTNFVCPLSTATSYPLFVSQSLTVLSPDPEAKSSPEC